MKTYRIIEEKTNGVSKFYPQYRESERSSYILEDKYGKAYQSTHSYFTQWETVDAGFGNTKTILVNVSCDTLKEAEEKIESQIKAEKESEYIPKTIIHEYKPKHLRCI